MAIAIAVLALVVALYAAVRARKSPTVAQLDELARLVAPAKQPTDPRLRTLED